jgi:hypothetical protein
MKALDTEVRDAVTPEAPTAEATATREAAGAQTADTVR